LEKQFGKGRLFVKYGNHFRLFKPHDRAVGYRRSARHTAGLARQASFTEEVLSPKDAYDRFFPLPGDDRKLNLALLDVKDGIRGASLGKNALFRPVLYLRSSFADFCQKRFGIERCGGGVAHIISLPCRSFYCY
jgi:hypothetical protein